MKNPTVEQLTEQAMHILSPLMADFEQSERKLVRHAARFSAEMHSGELRASGKAFFTHPVEVARLTAEIGMSADCVAAALLHDTIENTDASRGDIEAEFGASVASLVEGLTKIKTISFSSAHEKQAENFKKLLLEVAADLRVIVIKLLDRLHNIRTLEYLKKEKQDRIALETRDIFAPFAYKIGLHEISVELEDGAFKILEPDAYSRLERALTRESEMKRELIEQTTETVRTALAQNGVEVAIDFRTRGIYDTWRKRRNRGDRNRLHNRLHDHHYFQIITESVRDCYTALGLLHSLYPPVPGMFKDYIATPKTRYYSSLHSVVLVEMRRFLFQIRTGDMHEQSFRGILSLLDEERPEKDTNGNRRHVHAWLNYLSESQNSIDNPQEFLAALKEELAPDEVFVFTPEGELKALPRGATPLDFAFAVHSEIGLSYQSALVNGIEVELNVELETGDCVQIITDEDSSPEGDWLDYAHTRKAKKHIKAHIDNQSTPV